jgi:hypothetical protein
MAAGIVATKVAKWRPFPQMLQDAKLPENMEGVQRAGVQDLRSSNWGSGETKRILVINVFWTGESANEEAFTDRVSN